jgi:hypothetical protein
MGPATAQAIDDVVARMTPLPAALSAGATDANPNGKRYGRRDGKGRIVEAYGFDLSPLGARYLESSGRQRRGGRSARPWGVCGGRTRHGQRSSMLPTG